LIFLTFFYIFVLPILSKSKFSITKPSFSNPISAITIFKTNAFCMNKIYIFRFFIIVLLLGFKSIKSLSATLPTDHFRSAQSGAWDIANTWESSPDGFTNWTPSTSAPTSDANTITIRSGHIVTISSSTTVDQVVVTKGAVLDVATNAASVLTVNNAAGHDIVVQNGGIFKHNIASNSALPTFSGSATLEIQSGGILEAANNNGTSSHYANVASPIASNVVWNDNSIFQWNNTSAPAEGVTYFPASDAIPVFRFSQPVTIGGSTPTVINGILEANANVSFQGSGTKTFRNGITGTGKVGVTALNGGQFIINGATATLGGTGILELNNSGLLVDNSTTLTLTSDKTINNYTGGTGSVTDAGTLVSAKNIINGNSKIKIDGIIKTTNINGLTGGTNTTFASGFTVNVSATSSVEYSGFENQIVTPLTYNNLTISGSSSKTAGTGADISVSGNLNIVSGSAFALNGVNHLKLNGGGKLNINENSVFDNGGESQVSGGGSPKINIYGTFITRDTDGFTGLNTSIPGATSTPPPTIALNIFPGSTIEYGLAGDQAVSPRDDYKNITFSGSGTKTIPTCRPIGTVTIKDNVIADVSKKTFGDTTATNLVMTGGLLRVGGTGTKPDIAGAYNLTGGVIEFTNSGLTKQTIRSPMTYLNIEVSGSNVANSSGVTTLANGGSFTVKTGGSFDNNAQRIDGTVGNQKFTLEAGGTFKTGVKGGFSGNDSAALKNIENLVIDPKSTIVYTRSNQTITPLAAYPTLLLKGSGNKTVASGIVTISPNADSVVIDTSVIFKVSSGAKADFQNRPVIIHSTAGSTGMIGEITDGPSALLNATNVTVERFIPARRAFRFLSPSVTTPSSIRANWMEGCVNPNANTRIDLHPGYGTNITGSADATKGFDPTITNNPSLFTFNAATQKWESVVSTNGTLSAGNAYSLMVRGDRSIDMRTNNPPPVNTILRTKGALFAGQFSPEISATEGYYSFIGNPYAAAVDWNALTKENISTTYYAWDPALNERGAYVTYNGYDNITVPTISKVDQNIQPGQAFFVRTSKTNPQSPNQVSPSLLFKEANKTSINRAVFRPISIVPKLSIQLLSNPGGGSENTADAVVAFFDDEFTSAIGNEDSYKFTNLDENLAINRNGTALSIEGRPGVVSSDTIKLKMWQLTGKPYYLKLEGTNFSSTVTAFVKDAYLHHETPVDLASTTLLPFTIDTTAAASYASGRFSIIFKSSGPLPVTLTNVKAYQKEQGIQVEWTAHTETDVNRYEIEKSMDGQNFEFLVNMPAKGDNAAIEKYTWFDATANPGSNFYRIKIIEKSGAVKYSEIINVNVSKVKPGISISPNPVKGNVITLQLSNMEKGKYDVAIYNNLGQKVYDGTIAHDQLSASYTIVPVKVIPKGVYRLTVNKADKNVTETLIFE